MASSSKSVITPDSFSVAPNLLGLPLARPWRRLVAMLIDLTLVALLVRTGGFVLGIAGALMLWRMSAPKEGEGLLRRPVRNGLRFAAAFIVFLTLSWTWGLFGSDGNDDAAPSAIAEPDSQSSDAAGDLVDGFQLTGTQAITVSANVIRLLNESNPTQAQSRAQSIASTMREKSSTDQTAVAKALMDLARERNNQVMYDAVVAAFSVGETAATISVEDSLVRALVAALDGDDARVDTLRTQVRDALAGPEIARLQGRVRQANKRVDSLSSALEKKDGPHGLRVLLSSLLDDLGLGFGWSAVYFTATLALFRGQTPGKRLMRARVIRLDGKPLGWWYAFERFGGYAASLTLGLLGFAQIMWDRNRQGIHDKIVETVVIRA